MLRYCRGRSRVPDPTRSPRDCHTNSDSAEINARAIGVDEGQASISPAAYTMYIAATSAISPPYGLTASSASCRAMALDSMHSRFDTNGTRSGKLAVSSSTDFPVKLRRTMGSAGPLEATGACF